MNEAPRVSRTFWSVFMTVLSIGLAFLVGYVAGERKQDSSSGRGFDVLWRVEDLLTNEFFGTVPDTQDQVYGAVDGLVSTFDDPHTVFVRPVSRSLERDELRGHFGGIGAHLRRDDAGDIVLTVTEGGPAARAGVKDGDLLVGIDGASIEPGATVDEVVVLIRGDVDTAVVLTLRRPGLADALDISVTRERIETPSVEWRLLDAGERIGYLAISVFGERTESELQAALDELANRKAEKLVLDLRGNGGGLLDAAVSTTSCFVSDGVVLRETSRSGPERAYDVTGRGNPAQSWPVAVLVDGATASASEIVAGALRDHERGVLIGTRTYGKGSVQRVHELEDGSSLHVTTARWQTPNRTAIDKVGLEPDVAVAISAEDLQALIHRC